MNPLTKIKPVKLNAEVMFRCRLCGDCCRNIKDSVMLEPMDAYRLARHLQERGESVSGTEDVLARYAHASWLTDRFPVFLLNTGDPLDSCVFLKDGRCSVYEARPRVCRMYPFTAAPGERGRDFLYYLCMEKPYHFADGMVKPKEWLSENFTREARDALKADYNALPAINRNIQAMETEGFQRLMFQFLYYRYFNYELGEPFLPQFRSNLEKLKTLTASEEQARGG